MTKGEVMGRAGRERESERVEKTGRDEGSMGREEREGARKRGERG